MLKAHKDYNEDRCLAYVKDLTSEPLPEVRAVCPAGADCVSMFFVLSAISPEKMPAVLKSAYDCLALGGRVLFRDYGVRDLSQLRFAEGRHLAIPFTLRFLIPSILFSFCIYCLYFPFSFYLFLSYTFASLIHAGFLHLVYFFLYCMPSGRS